MPVCHGLSHCRPHLTHDPATYTSINSLSGGAGPWLRFQGAQPDSRALWGPQRCPLGGGGGTMVVVGSPVDKEQRL